MPLTDKQQEYLRHCGCRWNVKTGATGSGKSYVDVAVTIPQRIIASRGEGLLVLLGNTKGTLERNILSPMRDIWGPELVGNISSDNTLRMFGKKVYALGADNKKHVARIQGATFEYVYGDEVTTWSNDVFTMLKSRMRCEHSRFDGTCNPDHPQHWFKKFLDSDADIYQQSYTIDDGALPEKVVAELKKEYAGTVYYNRFILGQWCAAEGVVYPMFDRGKHVVKSVDRPYIEYTVSVDYGTVNPMSMGLWGRMNGKWYRVREYYWDSRAGTNRLKTDEEYYSDLEQLTEGHHIRQVVIDPSAASFIQCIRKHGKFHVQPAKNDVLNGIRKVASCLKEGTILFNDCCTASIEEFGLYRWDDKAPEDKPVKQHDHAMDDIRYFVNTVVMPDAYGWAIGTGKF